MNDTPNYPYLSGYLESTIKNLAYDMDFLKLKSVKERESYLIESILVARKEAIAYQNTIGN